MRLSQKQAFLREKARKWAKNGFLLKTGILRSLSMPLLSADDMKRPQITKKPVFSEEKPAFL